MGFLMKTSKSRTETLEILLGDTLVGYLSHTRDGKNVFIFDEAYIDLGNLRPRLSLSFNDEMLLRRPWSSNQFLPSFFSNLLPEGDFRKYITQQLNIKDQNEFTLFRALCADCPGNIIVKSENEIISPIVDVPHSIANTLNTNVLRFSLAGVQLKFSIFLQEGRYTLQHLNQAGNLIIKMPSSLYPYLPENEYSMMQLAASVGVQIPEVNLIPMQDIPKLTHLQNTSSQCVYAIKRLDRNDEGGRIHCEDFAQVLAVRPNEKYEATNYDTMARIINGTFKDGTNQLEQFLTRIFVNILLGNTDAHLKNWTICYPDGINPALAPAYDIVSTLEYIPTNVEQALNMAKVKEFYAIDKKLLRSFAKRIQVDEKFVLDIAGRVVEKANIEWPKLLNDLPIMPANREALIQHWKRLKFPFNISSLSQQF